MPHTKGGAAVVRASMESVRDAMCVFLSASGVGGKRAALSQQ